MKAFFLGRLPAALLTAAIALAAAMSLVVTPAVAQDAPAAAASAADQPKGPFVELELLGVYDGDTLDVRYSILPAPLDRLRVRIRGIDTPELGERARCPAENALAMAARKRLTELVGDSKTVRAYSYRWDKYGGRIDGIVYLNGELAAKVLVREGLAVPYTGTGARRDWCKDGAAAKG